MKTPKSKSPHLITRVSYTQGQSAYTPMLDTIAVEAPLEITLSIPAARPKIYDKTIAITMRTPGFDKELALGFLATEGVLSAFSHIEKVLVAQNKVHLVLKENVDIQLDTLERNFYTTSSCGICGKASLDAIKTQCLTRPLFIHKVTPEIIISLPEKLREHQQLFKSTGSIHAAGLFDHQGQFIEMYEDVGRHNALDKLIGAAFSLNQLPLSNKILMLSGRASFELLQKAVMAGIGLVLSVGAPSSMAIGLAEEYGITLLGFIKQRGFNIYNDNNRMDHKKT